MSLFVSSQNSKYNKQRCEQLRLIRKDLAEKLGIGYRIRSTPCEFKGKCKGTCPACEAEEKALLNALYTLNSNKGIKISNQAYENISTENFRNITIATPGVPAPYEYLQNEHTKISTKDNKDADKDNIPNDKYFVMGEPDTAVSEFGGGNFSITEPLETECYFGGISSEYSIDDSKLENHTKGFSSKNTPFGNNGPYIPETYERPITMGIPAPPPQFKELKKRGKRK